MTQKAEFICDALEKICPTENHVKKLERHSGKNVFHDDKKRLCLKDLKCVNPAYKCDSIQIQKSVGYDVHVPDLGGTFSSQFLAVQYNKLDK